MRFHATSSDAEVKPGLVDGVTALSEAALSGAVRRTRPDRGRVVDPTTRRTVLKWPAGWTT